jgi:2-oxo-4-hydroxy-4-carboxy-5-ureidoimidazoline decarboxylase
MPSALTLTAITAMDKHTFVDTLGDLFEHSPWVAETAWARHPFVSVDALHAAMMTAVRDAAPAQQIAFLRQHPELAGAEAQAGTMTGNSTFEQQGAGLDALSSDEFAELRRLNADYALRHGFPFIIAVLGHSKADILNALRIRTGLDTLREIDEALNQIARITRRRLDALFGVHSAP